MFSVGIYCEDDIVVEFEFSSYVDRSSFIRFLFEACDLRPVIVSTSPFVCTIPFSSSVFEDLPIPTCVVRYIDMSFIR